MGTQVVRIEDILIPEVRSNAVYSAEKYDELKASIAQSGIQFRPSLRPLDGGKFELIDGRHRLQVWKELGHVDIEVDIDNLTDEQAFVKHITANHHRGDADPVGLARIIKKLKDSGKTLEDIGKLIGYSGSQAAQYLQLAFLPDVYQQAVSQGTLKLAHIREATKFEDPREIDAALTYALQMKWTAEVLHHYVANRLNELTMVSSSQGAGQGEMIQPPPPSAQLAQYRTCLVCGALGEAHEMFYPALGKECHDTLKYLMEINKNPFLAVQSLVNDIQALQQEIAAKDQKIKELSERLIDLSMRLVPGQPQNQPQHYYPPAPTPAGVPIPGTQSPVQNR